MSWIVNTTGTRWPRSASGTKLATASCACTTSTALPCSARCSTNAATARANVAKRAALSDVRDAAFTVDAVAVEQARQVEQNELGAGRQLAVEHVHFAAVRERERRQPTRREQAPGLEARRARGGHRHPVPELTERLHQGRCRITGFGFPHVRGQFGEGEQNIHCPGVYHGQF